MTNFLLLLRLMLINHKIYVLRCVNLLLILYADLYKQKKALFIIIFCMQIVMVPFFFRSLHLALFQLFNLFIFINLFYFLFWL